MIEANYINEFLRINSELGRLSSHMLVNNHKYNTVLPSDILKQVDSIKNRLDNLSSLYSQQYKETKFNLER